MTSTDVDRRALGASSLWYLYEGDSDILLSVVAGSAVAKSGPAVCRAGSVRLPAGELLVLEAGSTGVVFDGVRVPPGGPVPSHPPVLLGARRWLVAHADKRVVLDELAQHIGYGKFHLVRRFREHFGVPPMTFKRVVRLWHARQAIREGVPLAQAAADSGYFDQAHLTRECKELWGCTPGEVRPPDRVLRSTSSLANEASFARAQRSRLNHSAQEG
ncbi:MAG: AraC family transcriptional regulator [Myxococcota bacterium]